MVFFISLDIYLSPLNRTYQYIFGELLLICLSLFLAVLIVSSSQVLRLHLGGEPLSSRARLTRHAKVASIAYSDDHGQTQRLRRLFDRILQEQSAAIQE